MTSLLGQAIRFAADMQGRAKWAWLEDRRESSQLCAGQPMVRVGHEAMRVRRPSSAVPFGLCRFDPRVFGLFSAEKMAGQAGNKPGEPGEPGYGYFRLKMPKLDQPLPVANLTSPEPTMYTCAATVGLCFLHTCTELLQESEQLVPKRKPSINIDSSESG